MVEGTCSFFIPSELNKIKKMSLNVKKDMPKSGFGKQDTLQAIVFADDFIHNLKPVQLVYPSMLFPLATVPLLNHLLETLVHSRVQQVFLYCSSHVEKLKAFVDSLKCWDKDIVVTPIVSDGCRSLGDALRDIDTKGFIRGDFILIRGTAFSNVNLRVLMDLHKARKEKDKNTALTMVFRNLGNVKDSTLKNESSIVVSNASTRKLLFYKQLDTTEKRIELDLQWFLEQDRVQIETALFDTRIYLCSQSLLPLFADNFDFQTMEDFIKGVLLNEEFLDSRIYWENLIYPEYALPITSWKTYQVLTKDILQRHCYPLVPDSLQDFIYMSKSTYKHRNSIISKGCSLHSDLIIGEGSVLGENSSIKKSVIGPKCNIGANVRIHNSHIISDCTIESGCNICDSIIFSNCTLKKDTELIKCILSPNVKCSEKYQNAFIETGNDGNLIVKQMEHRSDDLDHNFSNILTDDDLDPEDDDGNASTSSSVSSAWSSPSIRDSPVPQELQDDTDIFLSEVIDSLLRGYQDKLKCENLILEINSSRYAYNVSIRQVSYNVIKAILTLPLVNASKSESCVDSTLQPVEYHKTIKTMLSYFKPIIANYIKTENAQEDCLRAIQDVAYSNQEFIIPCAQNLLHFFYDNDILLEEKILEWYEQDCSNLEVDSLYNNDINDDQSKKQSIAKIIRTAVLPFVNWLQEAEEDSSDSS